MPMHHHPVSNNDRVFNVPGGIMVLDSMNRQQEWQQR